MGSNKVRGFDHRIRADRSYSSTHDWMRRNYPLVGRCEWCGTCERITERAAARGRNLTRNAADWLELCIPCHRNFDGQRGERWSRHMKIKLGDH